MADPANIIWETIGPAPWEEARGEVEILSEALRNSGACGSFLDRAARSRKPVLLIVNDGHRSTRTRAALLAIKTVATGMSHRPCFRALVATGTHTFTDDERREFEAATFLDCGLNIEDVAWHDALNKGSLTEVAGAEMHSWLASSEFLLAIGSVEPHYFAGVTGAHKTTTVGCMSRNEIERNHAHAISPDSDIMRLDGNPVFDGIAAIVRRLESAGKTIFAINEVVRHDSVIAAAAGDALDTAYALLPTVRNVYVRDVQRPVDILHLRVPLPLGRNLYQADKALKNNHLAVRDGGGILLEAACPDGVGPDAFLNLLRRAGDYASAVRCVRAEGYRLADHKAIKLRHLTDPSCRGVHVALVSPYISREDARTAGLTLFADASPALEWLGRTIFGQLAHGLIVEDAGCVSTACAG